jgi:hypothetical protein
MIAARVERPGVVDVGIEEDGIGGPGLATELPEELLSLALEDRPLPEPRGSENTEKTPRGQPTASTNPSILWLRGLDLNQRPLGYEGKSALHTDQREPTGTNYDGDLRREKAVPCWFVSVA